MSRWNLRLMILAVTASAAVAIGGMGMSPASAASAGRVGWEVVGFHGNAPVEPLTSADCLYYLNNAGYVSTTRRVEACNIGAGGGLAQITCSVILIDTGVSAYHAGIACRLADD